MLQKSIVGAVDPEIKLKAWYIQRYINFMLERYGWDEAEEVEP